MMQMKAQSAVDIFSSTKFNFMKKENIYICEFLSNQIFLEIKLNTSCSDSLISLFSETYVTLSSIG